MWHRAASHIAVLRGLLLLIGQEVLSYLAKPAVTSLFILLGCDRQKVCPTTFQVYLPFTDPFYRFFTACICGINPMDFGNVPSGMPGEKKNKWLFFLYSCCRQRGKQNPFLTMNPPADSSKSREWDIWKYNDKLISGEHSLCSGCQSVNKACLWGQRRHQTQTHSLHPAHPGSFSHQSPWIHHEIVFSSLLPSAPLLPTLSLSHCLHVILSSWTKFHLSAMRRWSRDFILKYPASIIYLSAPSPSPPTLRLHSGVSFSHLPLPPRYLPCCSIWSNLTI